MATYSKTTEVDGVLRPEDSTDQIVKDANDLSRGIGLSEVLPPEALSPEGHYHEHVLGHFRITVEFTPAAKEN